MTLMPRTGRCRPSCPPTTRARASGGTFSSSLTATESITALSIPDSGEARQWPDHTVTQSNDRAYAVHQCQRPGPFAPSRLARQHRRPPPDRHAGSDALRVQSVFRSVINVTTADGLLTVASPEGGGLPNGILADLGPDWRALGLRPGMVVRASETEIRVPDAGLEIRLAAAPRWSPRFRSSAGAVDAVPARWRAARGGDARRSRGARRCCAGARWPRDRRTTR